MKAQSQTLTQAKWLKGWLSDGDFARIENSVKIAERATCAEIVPMIVHSSSPTGHVPYLLFLLALTVLWTLLPYLAPWVETMAPGVPFEILELAAAAVAGAFTWLFKENDFLIRVLTPRGDRAANAMRRAQLEFYQSNIKLTEDKTGVLIFVSLREHQAVVLADKSIADKFSPETWSKILGDLIAHLKKGDLTGGMCTAIEEAGEILTQAFPIAHRDVNELPDHLVIKA